MKESDICKYKAIFHKVANFFYINFSTKQNFFEISWVDISVKTDIYNQACHDDDCRSAVTNCLS